MELNEVFFNVTDTSNSTFANFTRLQNVSEDKNFTGCSNDTQASTINNDHFNRDVFLIVLYTVTAIVAIIGNYFVCKIILSKNSKLRNSTNILVANLALSDLIGAITIPAQWLFCSYYVLENWKFEIPCAITKSTQVLSFYMSSLIMMLIALERFISVAFPTSPPFPSTIIVSITWLVTTLFVASSIGSAKIFEYFTPERVISCRIVFEFKKPFNSGNLRSLRVWGIWLGQYVIPLFVTILLYALIVRKVWAQRRFTNSTNSTSDKKNQRQRRLVIMLVLVVVVFLICWLPLHALNFTDYVIKKLEKKVKKCTKKVSCNDSTTYFFLYWFGISSCCYNPFIYWWMNDDFRKAFKKLLPSYVLRLIQSERRKHVLRGQVATEMSDIKLTNSSSDKTSSLYIRSNTSDN
ncbi:putative G-protein coupled receptor 83-like protein [Leptotrombidium deliense]|uniref:Putative G-protein coupled receptor 83-like protein n=1 Tax=Leptotrombidium deliense TaxID=299467 RepID=A0A443S7K5_9ACAR|nr:putative G-protein coupled receptor 83-like protein [Leptotrombidium deliense]